jgi:penicillin G amidase
MVAFPDRAVAYPCPVTRRRLKIGLGVVAGVVVLALLAGTSFVVWSVRRPFPEYDGTMELTGLRADVDVVRDDHGIPQIYADTAEDLFLAQGYVHAQDRFWEMDFRRHVTAGRISELFGEDEVDTDAFIRTLGWRRVAQQELPLLSPSTRRYLEAYADGVNAWLDGRSGGALGLQYTLLGLSGGDNSPEPWTPVDSLAWLKAMAWDLRSNMEEEIERSLLAAELPVDRIEQLYPDYPYSQNAPIVGDAYLSAGAPSGDGADRAAPAVAQDAVDALRSVSRTIDEVPNLLGEGAGVGSNSWVVDGSLTASGAPMLVNDPHLEPSMPSVWYQVGLHCRDPGPECPFEVAGYSFSGVPGIVIGHNAQIAWGFTNLAPDVSDLYLEQIEGDSYLVRDDFVPMETREETISVAGGDDVTITVRTTRHGPVVSDHEDQLRDVGEEAPVEDADARGDGFAVALRWTALDPGRTADALFLLNSADDWDSFRAAASMFEVPSQNMVYADVEGNVGYQAPGKIPIRRSGDGRWPAPGWTEANEWVGFIPFDALPSVLDPDEGFVVTANQPVTSEAYPFLLTRDFDYGQRAQRIRDLIEQAGPLDSEAMVDIQMDSYNVNAESLVPHLLEVDGVSGYYGDGVDLLRDWDFIQPPDSAPAAYFNAVWRSLLELTFHDELPEDQWPDGGGRWFEVVVNLLEAPEDPYWDDVSTEDEIETRDTVLRQALREARDEMTSLQGKDPSRWEWGRMHDLSLTDQTFGTSGIGPIEALVNRGPVDVGGGTSIVQATAWYAPDGYETIWVPSMRMVVDLGDLDASRWIDLTGVSGHPYHEHYGDQTELWRTGQTLPMRWSEDTIRSEADDTLTLLAADED